jgi:hypothetical protein
MDNQKILKEKRKQSSITTAAMSICVTPDALDSMMDVISAYNEFLKDKNETNYRNLVVSLHEMMLKAKIMRSEEELRLIKSSDLAKNGTIDDIIHAFFPHIERLEK